MTKVETEEPTTITVHEKFKQLLKTEVEFAEFAAKEIKMKLPEIKRITLKAVDQLTEEDLREIGSKYKKELEGK